MAWYDLVLDNLDKVRKVGDEKWVACCNVHNDLTPSLSITIKDKKLLMYCFSCGAKGDSVVESMGLNVSDLFEEKKEFEPDAHYLLRRTQEDDDFYILLYDSDKAKGKKIRYKDHKEYMAAMSRRSRRTELGIAQNIITVKTDGFL